MYKLLFDADAVIKLSYSGALPLVCKTFICLTTTVVKREVIDEGKKHLYPDAEVIEDLVKKGLLTIKESPSSNQVVNLDKGEASLVSLYPSVTKYIMVSDDKHFIQHLIEQRIPFFVPSHIIILLKKQGKITKSQALGHLDKMSAFISESQYKTAKQMLG